MGPKVEGSRQSCWALVLITHTHGSIILGDLGAEHFDLHGHIETQLLADSAHIQAEVYFNQTHNIVPVVLL